MKYLIFSLFFHSSYVFAQEAPPKIEPVPVADVRCGYGWIQCDKDGQPVTGEDKKEITKDTTKKIDFSKVDVSKLKTDVVNLYGGEHKEELLKDFEARQSYPEAFCLSDVIGAQSESTEATNKVYTNYLISGDHVIDVCSTPISTNGNKSTEKETAKKETKAEGGNSSTATAAASMLLQLLVLQKQSLAANT